MDDSGTSIGKASAHETSKKSHVSAASAVATQHNALVATAAKTRVTTDGENGPPAKRAKTGNAATPATRNAQQAPVTPVINAQQAQPAQQPVQPPQQAPPTPAAVTVPSVINAPSTPSGMGVNRIPPRVNTNVTVNVSSLPAGTGPVVFSIEANGGANGTATINGAATHTASAPGSISLALSGTTQTSAGSVGNLRLVAYQGTTRLARSGGFSISSVPQNWSTSFVSLNPNPNGLGMTALNSWQSDSGNVADLDQVQRMEQVQIITATGPWVGATQNVSNWRAATTGSIQDNHFSTPRSGYRQLGTKVANQTFVFKCDRMAVLNIPASHSGLLITRTVTAGATAGTFNFDISKVGAAVTANGYASQAASGSAVAPTQAF